MLKVEDRVLTSSHEIGSQYPDKFYIRRYHFAHHNKPSNKPSFLFFKAGRYTNKKVIASCAYRLFLLKLT